MSTESTFVTAAIAAHEKRKVRCFDIPSAFVNMDVDEDVLMVLKAKGRAGRHDDADSTSGIQEVRYH